MEHVIRVMIADDFEILLEDLSELINSQKDMKVVGTATSGKEIIAIATQKDYDIILMDIEMETAYSGIHAAELIRDVNKDAKIIYLTAHDTKDTILTAMATGAIDYIVKGAEEVEILDHIRNAYHDKPLLEPKIQRVIMEEYNRLRRSEKSLLFFINNISTLTKAEREIIRHLLDGKKVREIAEARCVEIVTIKSQIRTLLRKFGVKRTKEIVKMIEELNLTHLF